MQDNEVESCSYSLGKHSQKSKSVKKDGDAKSNKSKRSDSRSKSSFTKSLENVKVKSKTSFASDSMGSTSKPRKNRVKWTENDYDKFVKIIRRHGKDWKKINIELLHLK